jgi:DNA-binding NarL/FixJ family response regulator
MKNNQVIRVLSVDDHPLVIEGITTIVKHQPDMELIGEASNGQEALEIFRRLQPDVTLMDLRLSDMSGIDAMIAIRGEFPQAKIVMLTMIEGDAEIQRALKAGASAYILKNMSSKNLIKTIRLVHSGKKYIPPELAARLAEHLGDKNLTTRELEVLKVVSDGLRNQDIAEKLFISEETVKMHLMSIMQKLNANSRTQAVTIALNRGIIQL